MRRRPLSLLRENGKRAMRTWSLSVIACYASSPRRARELAHYLGWDEQAQKNVHDLTCIYFDYGQEAYQNSFRQFAPRMIRYICICECHRDGRPCMACANHTYHECLCFCHHCKWCFREEHLCENGCNCLCHQENCGDCCLEICFNSAHLNDGDVIGQYLGCNHNGHGNVTTLKNFDATYEDWFGPEEEEVEAPCGCHCQMCVEEGCEECEGCGYCSCCCCECVEPVHCTDDCECPDCYDECRDFCLDCGGCLCCCCECEEEEVLPLPVYETQETRLQRIAGKLKEATGKEFTAVLVDKIGDDKINAAAYPNREIRITNEMMTRLTDDDLAGVLGHELGHVAQEHIRRQDGYLKERRRKTSQRLEQLNQRMKAKGRGMLTRGIAVVTVSAVMAGGTTLGYCDESQRMEHEADDFSVEAAAEAGFDPMGNANALRRLDPSGRSTRGGGFFDTHPSNHARVERMRQKASEVKQRKKRD